jgi:putative membrane protein
MNIIIKLLITAVAAFGIAKLLVPHVEIFSFTSAIVFAIVLGILNLIVKPILSILSLPVTILTLGLFSLVVNTFIILLADYFTNGIHIQGFWWAFVFSILLSIVTSILESIFISKEE